MGREISIFSDYRQSENAVTNHCGILFRLIYRESPQQFESLVVSLLPEGTELRVGPVFTQQEKSAKSVPDLVVRQHAFNLFFETKLGDWFENKQLERHIDGLAKAPGLKILFCLSSEIDCSAAACQQLIQTAKGFEIIVHFLTFEDLLASVRELRLSNSLVEMSAGSQNQPGMGG